MNLWDTHGKNQDEYSFAFKLRPLLINRYRLDFRNEPALTRRMDIDGKGINTIGEFKSNVSYEIKSLISISSELNLVSRTSDKSTFLLH